MGQRAPGKSHRKGISVMQAGRMFATEEDAVKWFEGWLWPTGDMVCMRCGSTEGAYRVKGGKPMPYRCKDCKKYFSLKTGTAMEDSKLPLRMWGWAIYLELTSLKGVSAMKLHRDLGISYKAAWFMLHRIRSAFDELRALFAGPVEVDEAYFGGKRSNMSYEKRVQLAGTGRGAVGKTPVVGAKDRATGQVVARVIDRTDKATLQKFVDDHAEPDAALYTDDATAYKGSGRTHETVKHGEDQYALYLGAETVHTNGVESFWSMLKRAHKGVYHRLSPKHLQAYVNTFAGRHNIREMDTMEQMQHVVAGLVGKRLMYRDLIADTEPSAVAT